MNRKNSRTYLLLIAAILLLMSIPKAVSEPLKGKLVEMLAPLWGRLTDVRIAAENPLGMIQRGAFSQTDKELALQKLQNQLLLKEIEFLKKALAIKKGKTPFAMPAKVIFRSPSSWNSSFWIDVGSEDNAKLNQVIIAKNSPVVIGNAVVGVIDYVGKKQSRVKLITDSGLSPSVRALRGQRLLAKGELRGSSKPLWRAQGTRLKGIGFNYDFSDEKGPARDLRTGEPIGSSEGPAIPILQMKDLLVTTGLDGVFPEGLLVAEVVHIDLLHEGDYFYTLEAEPVVQNMQDLSVVFVIPPVGYDPLDLPPRFGD